jgi:uncharacterized membrane protein YGL010W
MIHPIRNWLSRHRNPANFWIHMLGIPATIAAVPLAAAGRWAMAGAFFVAGYALQFLGHAVEGNRSGEAMLIRRLLRLDGDGGTARTTRPARRKRRSG